MAGVRSNDQKGRLVPYTPSNGASGGNINHTNDSSSSNNPYTAYDGKKANGLAAYNGTNNSTGTGSGNFTKGSNFSAGAGNHGPSAPANDFRPGSGHFGGTTRAADSGTAQQQRDPGPAQGYPVINHGGGAYVASPVPVSNWHGSAPSGPQQNAGFTTNGPANLQLENGTGGKTFGSGGAGGYGPAVPHGYGGQSDSVSGSEKHHHHHYYYNNHQHHPVPYNNNSVLPEEKKRRRRGAGALAAALIACWACTCCCHVPCGC
ncbi:hypothetical protein Mapa_004919 [Marchantia paleacea]|nr:hypothetical protein Mapa_004919 [Marchantia paleacea]